MLKKMTKMANSRVGYLDLPRQLASLCKGWVGNRYCDRLMMVISLGYQNQGHSINPQNTCNDVENVFSSHEKVFFLILDKKQNFSIERK